MMGTPVGITRSTPVLVCIDPGHGEEHRTTWGEFCADNDSLSDGDRMLIAVNLSIGETYRGGGGASPEFTIRRAP